MAFGTKLVSILLLAFLVCSMISTQVLAKGFSSGPGSLSVSQCPGQCSRRCGNTQYHKPCMFFCQKCCNKCLCVPPGTYGNKEVCGSCYTSWKTKRGGPKCP